MSLFSSSSSFLRTNISSKVLVITGLLLLPSFLFQQSVLLKSIQTLLFILASVFTGKKLKVLPPLIMLISITVINLFTPTGRVLVSLGRFHLTYGAFIIGLNKALTLIGLIYLSRSSVRSDLKIPGRFGSLLARTFYYFDRINETWSEIPKQSILDRLDALLVTIYTPEKEKQSAVTAGSTSTAGLFTLILFGCVQWVLFSLQYAVT